MDGESVLSLHPPRGPLCAFIPPSFLCVVPRSSASHRPNSQTLRNVHKAEREGDFYLLLNCLSFCSLSPSLVFLCSPPGKRDETPF